ncbi:hypothetical protein BB560_001552 [Smittium megazygosporum]|uniref:Uncharacterized protein n=1 Tax=Smittium megazygosporum TaxID=133381 RepID=A0A2T9ZH94_9FUNG|nr:hypothetical protein BB560_001552 [Smittium megazygosporum]
MGECWDQNPQNDDVENRRLCLASGSKTNCLMCSLLVSTCHQAQTQSLLAHPIRNGGLQYVLSSAWDLFSSSSRFCAEWPVSNHKHPLVLQFSPSSPFFQKDKPNLLGGSNT